MNGVLSIGLQTVASGYDKLNRDSERAMQAFTTASSEDLVSAMTDLTKDALEIRAGTRIIRTGTELSRYTLDIMA